jgi:hypothetical protein
MSNPTERELTEELARVIYPEAYGLDADDIVDDIPVAQAEARLYASRVAAWLGEHDREVSERAVTAHSLAVANALLKLIPPNPYGGEP